MGRHRLPDRAGAAGTIASTVPSGGGHPRWKDIRSSQPRARPDRYPKGTARHGHVRRQELRRAASGRLRDLSPACHLAAVGRYLPRSKSGRGHWRAWGADGGVFGCCPPVGTDRANREDVTMRRAFKMRLKPAARRSTRKSTMLSGPASKRRCWPMESPRFPSIAADSIFLPISNHVPAATRARPIRSRATGG